MSSEEKMHRARALIQLIGAASHDQNCDAMAMAVAAEMAYELLGEIDPK